jgi:hypothetical protein
MIVYYDPSDPDSYKLRYIKSYNPFVEEFENGSTLLLSKSYYDYEQELNNKRRFIQVLKPAFLNPFVKLFQASVDYKFSKDLTFDANVKKTLNKTSIFNNITL